MIRRATTAICMLAGLALLIMAGVSAKREIFWDMCPDPQPRADWITQPAGAGGLRSWQPPLPPQPQPQRWLYAHLAESHAVLAYSSCDRPPFAALKKTAFMAPADPYVRQRQTMDAQWCSLHPEAVDDPTEHPKHYSLYLEEVGIMREYYTWHMGLSVRDTSWMCRYTDAPCFQVVVRFPLIWLGALLLLCPAAPLAWARVRRWHRRSKGWCVTCGYDLTGNVTGICSECGQAIDYVIHDSYVAGDDSDRPDQA